MDKKQLQNRICCLPNKPNFENHVTGNKVLILFALTAILFEKKKTFHEAIYFKESHSDI